MKNECVKIKRRDVTPFAVHARLDWLPTYRSSRMLVCFFVLVSNYFVALDSSIDQKTNIKIRKKTQTKELKGIFPYQQQKRTNNNANVGNET